MTEQEHRVLQQLVLPLHAALLHGTLDALSGGLAAAVSRREGRQAVNLLQLPER